MFVGFDFPLDLVLWRHFFVFGTSVGGESGSGWGCGLGRTASRPTIFFWWLGGIRHACNPMSQPCVWLLGGVLVHLSEFLGRGREPDDFNRANQPCNGDSLKRCRDLSSFFLHFDLIRCLNRLPADRECPVACITGLAARPTKSDGCLASHRHPVMIPCGFDAGHPCIL